MLRRPLVPLAILCGLVAIGGCNDVDLSGLKVVGTLTGYHDDGKVPPTQPHEGENRILPSITFQLKNEGTEPLSGVDLVVAFWQVNAGAAFDEKVIKAISRDGLAPGATSESFTVRATLGFTSPYATTDFFTHSQWRDFEIRLFAQKAGRTLPLGQIPVDRRLLPTARRESSRP